jgi:acylphosphatase
MSEERKAVRARVTGRVQGVSYRVWTRAEARSLGLTGWVRNEPDGSVAALLAGRNAAVSAMLERLWSGPPGASVRDVAVADADPAEAPPDFRITV